MNQRGLRYQSKNRLVALQNNRHYADIADEVVRQTDRITGQFNRAEALHDFFPENPQRHLGQAIIHATMHPETKGYVRPRIRSINNELVGIPEYRFVAVSRQTPHNNLVIFLNPFSALIKVLYGRAAHMDKRRLPADHFRQHVRNQGMIRLKFYKLIWESI